MAAERPPIPAPTISAVRANRSHLLIARAMSAARSDRMRKGVSLRLDAGKREDAERSANFRRGGTVVHLGLRHDANDVAGQIDEREDAGVVERSATSAPGQCGRRGLSAVASYLPSQ